ncbi:MAG: trehalose-phosphatase [Dehalococcoidia bacterium]|nr:MAG: trehalose-phosphatase [Dehalococcoidia bacterium]
MARALTSIEPLLPVIRRRPLGLLSDIDGTLSPIVARPEDAAVPDAIREALRRLAARGVKVALITGRSLDTARRMVGLDDVAYAADPGLTVWLARRREAAAGMGEYEAPDRPAEGDLQGLSQTVPGVQLENKGALLAVHYRRAEGPGAREAILEALGRSQAAQRFRVQEGRMMVELRPPLRADKGTAMEMLIAHLGLQGAICLGDDITDIDMFAALRQQRAEGLAGAAVAVVSKEAAPEVEQAADYTVEGPEGVEWLLTEMVRALP